MLKNLLFLSSFILVTACASGLKEKTPREKKAELYYGHGTSHLIKKDYTSALDYLLKAVELAPKDSKVHNNLGMAYYFKKDNQKAIKHLKKSIDLEPKNSEARNNIAGIYAEMNQLQKAKEQYNVVVKDLLYKHQYRTYYNLALIDLKENNPNKAQFKLVKSIKENEQYCPAYYQLGLISRQNFAFRKAVEFFKKASLGPCVDSPAPQYQQALSYIDLNHHEKAFHKLREIIERFPTSHYSILATRKLKAIKVNQFRKKKYNLSKLKKTQIKTKKNKKSDPKTSTLNF